MKSIKVVLYLVMLLILGSCSERQDFTQYDDISLTPTYEASILYMEAPERLINQVTTTNFFTQDFNFDAFSEPFFAERVLDGIVIYEVQNTTSKALDIVVEFLDEAGNTLDMETFRIDPAPTAVLRREIAYGNSGRSLDIVRNTSTIRVSATNLGDNTSTSSLPDPLVTLKSSGQFRLRLK
jgi:hypothetical protein